MTHESLSRRQILAGLGAGLLVPGLAVAAGGKGKKKKGAGAPAGDAPAAPAKPAVTPATRIKQSVSFWCFNKWYPKDKLDEFCKAVKPLGVESVELLGPEQWAILKANGMTCALGSAGMGIAKGFNRTENHEKLVADYETAIDAAVAAGNVPTLICMSGNREGMDDETGIKNCVAGVKRIVGKAEKAGINIVMELLNSKVNHKDYMADHTAWGAEVVKGVGSERFKLLYDIYHMQIMEGDMIATIKKFSDCIGHYHTGGVPGRNEIDETQEIYYPAVCKAILETGYQGWIGHEFIPKAADPLKSLANAVKLCCG